MSYETFATTDAGNDIMYEPVIGWVVIAITEPLEDPQEEQEEDAARAQNVFLQPLIAPTTTTDATTAFGDIIEPEVYMSDEILGVIPDSFNTMRVSTLLEDEGEEFIEVLGYEYAGATNPDWDSVIEPRRTA